MRYIALQAFNWNYPEVNYVTEIPVYRSVDL